MKIIIPDFCLVVLASAAGRVEPAFMQANFTEVEIVSTPSRNGSAAVSSDTLGALEEAIGARLRRRCLTVVDGCSAHERARLLKIAKAHYAQTIAIVFDPDSVVGAADTDAARKQAGAAPGSLDIGTEGFHSVHYLRSEAEISAAAIERTRLRTDLRAETGPFDIIGDVHGCAGELVALLTKLGYSVQLTGTGVHRRVVSRAPEGRRAAFVGDLVDRGPASPDVLRIVMHMAREGQALTVPGNHDIKLLRWHLGRKVKFSHGLAETVSQLAAEPEAFRLEIMKFIEGLASHAWLEGGDLTVVHAGIRQEMMGRDTGAVREFCLYGDTSGETDEFGLPVRYHWAAEYRGETAIVYGHTPVPEAEWFNNTLCIDTGCVFGGKLTALRWPEREIVSVPAAKAYATTIRPFAHPPVRPGYVP